MGSEMCIRDRAPTIFYNLNAKCLGRSHFAQPEAFKAGPPSAAVTPGGGPSREPRKTAAKPSAGTTILRGDPRVIPMIEASISAQTGGASHEHPGFLRRSSRPSGAVSTNCRQTGPFQPASAADTDQNCPRISREFAGSRAGCSPAMIRRELAAGSPDVPASTRWAETWVAGSGLGLAAAGPCTRR